jgi:hypothetical protein
MSTNSVDDSVSRPRRSGCRTCQLDVSRMTDPSSPAFTSANSNPMDRLSSQQKPMDLGRRHRPTASPTNSAPSIERSSARWMVPRRCVSSLRHAMTHRPTRQSQRSGHRSDRYGTANANNPVRVSDQQPSDPTPTSAAPSVIVRTPMVPLAFLTTSRGRAPSVARSRRSRRDRRPPPYRFRRRPSRR